MYKNSKKGFTLIELVIVILIIAILFVVLVPQLSAMVNKAKTAGVQEDFREFSTAAQAVAYEQGGFKEIAGDSDADGKLVAAINANMDATNKITAGETATKDPWNKAYTYAYDNATNSVTFTSGGANGAIGTGDDDLSITVKYDENGSVVTSTKGFSLDKAE